MNHTNLTYKKIYYKIKILKKNEARHRDPLRKGLWASLQVQAPACMPLFFKLTGVDVIHPMLWQKKNTQHVLSIGKQRVIYNFSDSGYCGGWKNKVLFSSSKNLFLSKTLRKHHWNLIKPIYGLKNHKNKITIKHKIFLSSYIF